MLINVVCVHVIVCLYVFLIHVFYNVNETNFPFKGSIKLNWTELNWTFRPVERGIRNPKVKFEQIWIIRFINEIKFLYFFLRGGGGGGCCFVSVFIPNPCESLYHSCELVCAQYVEDLQLVCTNCLFFSPFFSFFLGKGYISWSKKVAEGFMRDLILQRFTVRLYFMFCMQWIHIFSEHCALLTMKNKWNERETYTIQVHSTS